MSVMHEWYIYLHWPVSMHKADNGCIGPWHKLYIVRLFRHGNMIAVNMNLSFVYTSKISNYKKAINCIPEIIAI